MTQYQETKYDIKLIPHATDAERFNPKAVIVNRVSGEQIPDDQPIIIFRARDKNVFSMLQFYALLCKNDEHKTAVLMRAMEFGNFAFRNPDRMKEPDTASEVPLDLQYPTTNK